MIPGVMWAAALAVATLTGDTRESAQSQSRGAAQRNSDVSTVTVHAETRAARLAALSPDNPMAYFELAEDVAAEQIGLDDRDLARQLYVFAAALSTGDATQRSSPEVAPPWLAASACLGLASLAETDAERRWLHALAGTLAPEDARGAISRSATASRTEPGAEDLAAALDSLRAGYGQRAAKLLERPGASELLDRYERLLTADGRPGGAARVRALIAKYPVCRECRNERVVRDKDGAHLCPTCGGRPGPHVQGLELVGQLRLESLLVSGIQRSWAAQVIADDGAPLRELDIQSVVDAFGVDLTRPWWRQGRWSSSASPDAMLPATPPSVAEPQP